MARAEHTTPSPDGAPVVPFASAAAFAAWLEANSGAERGVWLLVAKQGSGIPSITSDEAVDVGLCFGWIAGQRKSLDAHHYLQKYVPRRSRSRWSAVNVAKVEALTAAGRMRPSGLAEADAAKADGRWAAAYASQRHAVVPEDLLAAIEADRRASRAFAKLGRTQRYRTILEVLAARSASVRERAVDRAVSTLASLDDATSSVPEGGLGELDDALAARSVRQRTPPA